MRLRCEERREEGCVFEGVRDEGAPFLYEFLHTVPPSLVLVPTQEKKKLIRLHSSITVVIYPTNSYTDIL